MCFDAATSARLEHLENLLKQHEDASDARLAGLCGMVAGLQEATPPACYQFTLSAFGYQLFSVTLRPLEQAVAYHYASAMTLRDRVQGGE